MKVPRSAAICMAGAAALSLFAGFPQATAAPATTSYTVVAEDGASDAAVRGAIAAAGGTVTGFNAAVGSYSVVANANGFVAAVSQSSAVLGAAHAKAIGKAPQNQVRQGVEREHAGTGSAAKKPKPAPLGMDPLDGQLWGLSMIHADKSRKVQPGNKGVTVGVIDTGVDASHPDLAPNFNWSVSRNFAPDMTDIDGPCEFANCLDPVGVDDGGHGTHVAGTIAAAVNGLGVSGVAPNVSLVELKAGQDSGYFFLEPTVNALTYAGDHGIDVVNMSFYVDPWLYNCTANPADTPEDQIEQRAIIAAMNRALRYAHRKGVTLVGSLGNNHEDLGAPRTDVSSPDYPVDTAYPRPIDNSTCVDLPVEGPNVIGVSAIGPSTKKADYSNYGVEQISVAAPGGWFRDGFGTPTYRTNGNLILSTYPLHVAQEEGNVDAAGNLTPAGLALGYQKDCKGSVCGYYAPLQGTSMASPHASGVAALIVSQYGHRSGHFGGMTLNPDLVERVLYRSATPHACPNPPLQSYTNEGRPAEFDALCVGNTRFNGFYGYGIVDAWGAVTGHGLGHH